ncbi:MAG TPA: DUF2269 family protein [Acidimicrobiales bacterium]|jgi:uncharacterized membrane protein|nr:DUF2269 family protein [Acidimicrobiales bacterium]
MVFAASGFSTGYDIVKSLHILAAIIGFGAVFFNALYGLKAKEKRGSEAAFLAHTVFEISKLAEWFIYAVFILGFAALGMSDDRWEFSQTWVWLSVLLYIVGIALSHAIVLPNAKAMNALMDELAAGPPPGAAGAGAAGGPPPQALELEERGKRQATVAMVLDVILVVIVFLMVMKPGV